MEYAKISLVNEVENKLEDFKNISNATYIPSKDAIQLLGDLRNEIYINFSQKEGVKSKSIYQNLNINFYFHTL